MSGGTSTTVTGAAGGLPARGGAEGRSDAATATEEGAAPERVGRSDEADGELDRLLLPAHKLDGPGDGGEVGVGRAVRQGFEKIRKH